MLRKSRLADVTGTTVDAAAELAAFLRARRERLEPQAVGLPVRSRRRTPGLRREEVAELANVSVDYVVRLEQGRGLRPSPEVLDALARALRLSDDEHAYVFDLTRHWSPESRKPNPPSTSLIKLVRALSPMPAMLIDHRFDVLAWNPEMCGLMIDFEALADEQRNTMWLCVLHPDLIGFYRDRERIIREGIADLRAAWAAHPDDTGLAELIDSLTAQSPEFAALWARRDVRVNGAGRKHLVHPRYGPVTVEYDVLTPLRDSGQRLIVYRAADVAAQETLDAIAAVAAAGPPALRAG
jgi:transcriptional regulator with XRE-family HTH domain